MNLHHLIILTGTGPTGATGGGGTLAAGQSGAQQFWATSAGSLVSTLLAVVGILVVLGAAINIGRDLLKGKEQKMVGKIIAALFVAALCFDPQLITDGISAMTSAVSSIINSLGSLVGNSSSAGPSAPASSGSSVTPTTSSLGALVTASRHLLGV